MNPIGSSLIPATKMVYINILINILRYYIVAPSDNDPITQWGLPVGRRNVLLNLGQ